MTSSRKRPNIYTVSLVRATKRRKAILEQFTRYGVASTFVDAVDFAHVDPEYLHSNVDEAAVLRNIGRNLSGPEIACALSHRFIYRTIVELDEPGALILEDDVEITGQFLTAWDFFSEIQHRISSHSRIYHLGTIGHSYARDLIVRRRTRVRHKDNISFVSLVPNWSAVWGTYGYYITRKAALSLLKTPTIITVADGWEIFQREGFVQDIYISEPSVVVHPADMDRSDIIHGRQREQAIGGMKKKQQSSAYWSASQKIKNYLVRPIVERLL